MSRKKHLDPHVTVSFSIPRSVKARLDERIETLGLTRTDYLKLMILWELDKGPEALFDLPRTPKLRKESLPQRAGH